MGISRWLIAIGCSFAVIDFFWALDAIINEGTEIQKGISIVLCQFGVYLLIAGLRLELRELFIKYILDRG